MYALPKSLTARLIIGRLERNRRAPAVLAGQSRIIDLSAIAQIVALKHAELVMQDEIAGEHDDPVVPERVIPLHDASVLVQENDASLSSFQDLGELAKECEAIRHVSSSA